MKKVLAFLLMVMVAGAAFTPCCVADDCQDETTATAAANDGKPEQAGGCSPFFACMGCAGFTSMEKFITVPVPMPLLPGSHQELSDRFGTAICRQYFKASF